MGEFECKIDSNEKASMMNPKKDYLLSFHVSTESMCLTIQNLHSRYASSNTNDQIKKDHIIKTGIEPASSNNRLDILPLNYSIISSATQQLHISFLNNQSTWPRTIVIEQIFPNLLLHEYLFMFRISLVYPKAVQQISYPRNKIIQDSRATSLG